MYTIILKHVLHQSVYIYLYNRLNHNVLISTFGFVIIWYKLVKIFISSVPRMLSDPLNTTKPNMTLKHCLLSKYFIWEQPRSQLMTSRKDMNYFWWVSIWEIDHYMRTLWYNLSNNKNEGDTRWVCLLELL